MTDGSHTPLLPCPFCGDAPVTEHTGFSGRAMYVYCINDNGCPRPKAIGETEEKAIENWNIRSVNSLPSLVKALEEIFAVGDGFDVNTKDNPCGTTGEGHARCREIARAALSSYRGEGK